MGPAAAAAAVLVAFVLLLHSSYQKKIQRFQVWLLHQQLSLPLAVRQHEVQVSRWAMVVAVAVAGKEEVFHIAVAALVHLAFPTAAAAAAAVAMEGVDQDDHIAAAANPIAEVVAAAAVAVADY